MHSASKWSLWKCIWKTRRAERIQRLWDFLHENVDKKMKDTFPLKEIKLFACEIAKTANKILNLSAIFGKKSRGAESFHRKNVSAKGEKYV